MTRPAEPWSPRTPPVAGRDLRAHPFLVLHYWAQWNRHDRAMDDPLRPLSDACAGRITFRSCDIDLAANRPFVRGLASIPALGCFLHGRWRQTLVGLRDDAWLRSTLDRWRAAAVQPDAPPGQATRFFDRVQAVLRHWTRRRER